MKPKIFSLATIFVAMAASSTDSSGAVIANDDFESNSTTGGSGWASGWSVSGGSYMNSGSVIDGTYTLGLYGQNNDAVRSVVSPITTTGDIVTVSWSMRAGWDVVTDNDGGVTSELGLNLRDQNGNTLITFKFLDGAQNGKLQVNDGGSNFAINDITFATNNIYDFTFTSELGTNTYDFTVNRRGSSESFSTPANTYFFTGGSMTSFEDVRFFMTAPSGSGNDGFLDSVSVTVIPEPSAALLGGLGMLALLRRRRA
ncbi:MAG TPA: hypothetical protein VLO11_00475 [Luteolibacter sp.]|nr:hypothetical protein [Luteolibacter sp.]